MSYAKTFNPHNPLMKVENKTAPAGRDLRDGSVYVFSEPVETDPTALAVRVALATGRPLLLCGLPGSGKSSLAPFVARAMNWNYFEQVITSRTSAQELQWSFDAVRRLRDAQAKELHAETGAYLEPKVLWWAFNPASARKRGFNGRLPSGILEAKPIGILRGVNHPSVALLDEIDKADPDVPNDLLVALGSQRFRITETGKEIVSKVNPLVIITSNNERALPYTFLRRCVVHWLELPDERRLVEIANSHFPDRKDDSKALFETLALIVCERRKADNQDSGSTLSTPEYLDAVRACLELNVRPGDSPEWKAIEAAVFAKRVRS